MADAALAYSLTIAAGRFHLEAATEGGPADYEAVAAQLRLIAAHLDPVPADRDAAIRWLEAHGLEALHAQAHVVAQHGHPGACCCLMGACDATDCHVNTVLIGAGVTLLHSAGQAAPLRELPPRS